MGFGNPYPFNNTDSSANLSEKATAADVLVTNENVRKTDLDRQATAAYAAQTALDRIATGHDAESTGEDVIFTHADVVTTTSNKNAAALSESNAAIHDSNANTHEINAASYASAANQSKADANALYVLFGKKFLGDKTTDPTLDNDGNALVTGAVYFNTVSQLLKRWSGSAWVTIFNPTVSQGPGTSTTNVMSEKASTDNFAAKVLVIGKNKFNIAASDIQLGYFINQTNGNAEVNASYNATGYIPVTAGTTYFLSYKNRIAWYNSSKVFISGSNYTDSNQAQTAPAGAVYLRCAVVLASWSAFQVEIGSSGTTWEAYSSTITLESIALPSHNQAQSTVINLVTDLAAKAQLVDVPGKNKFNPFDADVSLGYYINYATGATVSNASYNSTGYVPVVPGVPYCMSESHHVAWYNSSKVYISGNHNGELIQTAPAGAAYMRSSVLVANWSVFQIEVGYVNTAYEAYTTHKEVSTVKYQPSDLFGSPLYMFFNRIAMPAKQYFLGGYENTIYHQAICERWLPNMYNVQIEAGGFQNRQLFSRITNPSADASVDAKLYDLDFYVQSYKNFALLVGAQATNNGALVINAIGDSLTYNSSYLLRARQLCPSLSFSGMRVPYGDTAITVEGRGGWKLSDYFSQLHQTTDSFSPFMHLADPYRYFGNTDFWKKVVTGNVSYGYAGFATLATTIGFSASTGLKSSPATNDVMYNDTNLRYERWDGSAWVPFTAVAGDFSFNYAKYRAVWGITQPNIVTIMLGINDFMTTAISAIPAAFVTWKANMEALITSVHADSPNAKIALLLPHSTVAGANDGIDYGYPVLKYNASMWNARKLMIDNFDAREAEKIYVVDVGSAVDPIFGFPFNTAEKPFSDYSGTETVKLQLNNPHPSTEGYYQMGIRLAGFIQSIR